MSTPNKTRLSININDDTAAQLQKMTQVEGITITEAVRRAVAVYKFFDDVREQDQAIQIVDRKGDKVSTVQLLV